jgi:hypothetical protein
MLNKSIVSTFIAMSLWCSTSPTFAQTASGQDVPRDKAFWQAVMKKEFKVPTGVPLPTLLDELSTMLGSPDPELRDDIAYSVLANWTLASFVRMQLRMRAISDDLIATTRSQAEYGQSALQGLGFMAQMAAEDRSRFTVLLFPELIRLDDYPYNAILEIVRAYCRDRGIELVDLLPALAEHRDRDLWVHETDHHPNPTAHAIAAKALLAVASR